LSRFLFVLTGHTTHVGAHASIAAELLGRDNEVAWAGPHVDEPLPAGTRFHPVDDESAQKVRAAWLEEPTTGSFRDWFFDLRWLYDRYLIPLALATLGVVEHLIDEFDPDVVVADEHALAAAFAVRLLDRRWATVVRSAALAAAGNRSRWPEIGMWLAAKLDEAQRRVGLAPVPRPNLSDHLVIGFSTPELHGRHLAFPGHYRFVGPALDHRTSAAAREAFPWEELRPGSRLLVSLGTSVGHRASFYFEAIRDALADTGRQVILVAPPEALPDPPSNFVVRASVPQLALLPHVDAVVSHGGYNTVLETLAHGLPLVVAPFTLDQPVVAEQVVRCGAGVRVRTSRAQPEDLADAVATVIDDPRFRQAAERIRDSFAAAGGTAAAASALAELAR
jgi:MGT family glycosyltransferase